MTCLYDLRGAAKRMIVEPYKTRHPKNKIGIITAPTGFGKTYNIMNTLIPWEIKNGITHFIILTVYKDNVFQDFVDYERALAGIARVTTDLEDFLTHNLKKDPRPIVFLNTLAGASNGGSRSDETEKNSTKILDFVKQKKGNIALFWDEAHFAASSTKKAYRINSGLGSTSTSGNLPYNAAYYSLIESACKKGCKVTGFTATPVFEQKGLLDGQGISKEMYVPITEEKDWPTVAERTECTSQIENIEIYDIDETYVYALKKFCIDFFNKTEKLKASSEEINEYLEKVNSEDRVTNKITALVSVGKADTKTGLDKEDAIDIILECSRGKVNEKDWILGCATQEGYTLRNCLGESKKVEKTEFFAKIFDDNDPLKFIVFIEKFKFGLNIRNAKYAILLRKRHAIETDFDYVTNPIIQIFGRLIRTFFAIKDANFNFVSDAIKTVLEKYRGTKIYNILKSHMEAANSHVIYVPNSPIHVQAVQEWKEKYAVTVNMSQFRQLDKSTNGTLFDDQLEDPTICPTCGRSGYYHIDTETPVDDESISKALGIEKRIH